MTSATIQPSIACGPPSAVMQERDRDERPDADHVDHVQRGRLNQAETMLKRCGHVGVEGARLEARRGWLEGRPPRHDPLRFGLALEHPLPERDVELVQVGSAELHARQRSGGRGRDDRMALANLIEHLNARATVAM